MTPFTLTEEEFNELARLKNLVFMMQAMNMCCAKGSYEPRIEEVTALLETVHTPLDRIVQRIEGSMSAPRPGGVALAA